MEANYSTDFASKIGNNFVEGTQDPLSGNTFDPISLHRYLYANANPIMLHDPSGRTTLTELQVAVAIIEIEVALAVPTMVATVSALSMARYGYVEWVGGLAYGTLNFAGPATLGAMVVSLRTSQCYRWGRSPTPLRSYGTYLVELLGLSFGATIGSIAGADVTVASPSVLGPDPLMLMGPAMYLSGTVAWGEGRGYTLFTMGFGAAKIGLLPEPVYGIDVGVDVLVGISVIVTPFWGYEPCVD